MTGITRSRHNRSQFFIFRAQNQISFCLCPFSSTTPASTKAFFSLQSFIYGCSTCTILSRNSISGFVTYKVNQTPWITPNLNIRRKLIKVIPTYQPNRVLFHKPTDFRFKVVHQAVMQSGLFIIILVVQSERLMCVPIDPFLISGAPRRCIRRTTGDYRRCRSSRAECRFSAVEVAGLLASFAFFVGLVMYLCQGFVCTSHTLRQDWRLHAGYGLLGLLYS